MSNSFITKGNICQTKNPKKPDIHENALAVCVDGVSKGVFDAVVMDDSVLSHTQSLNIEERMERAVYLGLDEKNITAKFAAGRKFI